MNPTSHEFRKSLRATVVGKLGRTVVQELLSRRVFILFAVALVTYVGLGMYFLSATGSYDYWEHLATMNAFSRNPFRPAHPYLLTNQSSHLFTPYHFLWGSISRLTSVHVFWLLPLIASLNMIAFVMSTYFFSQSILGTPKYALPLSLSMLFFWNNPWAWSGFYHFGLLPLTAIYPYWFAMPMMLFLIATYQLTSSFTVLCLYGLSVSFVFITHPLTGSFLILALVAKTLLSLFLPWPQRLFSSSLLLACVGGCLWFWPFFPIFDTILGSQKFSEVLFSGEWSEFYENAQWRTFPSWLGLFYIGYLLYTRKYHFITILAVLAIFIYGVNYFLFRNAVLARYIIFIAFCGHLGIVYALKELENRQWYPVGVLVFLSLALVFGSRQLYNSLKFIGPIRHAVTKTPSLRNSSLFRDYSRLKPYLNEKDVVLAPLDISWHLPAIVRCRVVGVEHSDPFLRDFVARKTATYRFFNANTTDSERRQIVSSFLVNRVLVPKPMQYRLANFLMNLTVLFDSSTYTLYAID